MPHQRPAVLCLLTVLLLTTRLPAAENDPARFAPRDAIAYVGIDDLTAFQQQLEQTAMFRLMKDPAAAATREMSLFNKIIEQAREGFATALKTEPDKLRNPFGGNLALFMHETSDPDKPGFAAVIGIKDQAVMREYYAKLLDRFKVAADSYERVEFSDVALDVFTATTRTPEIDPEELGFDPNSDPFSLGDEAMGRMVDATFGQWFSGETLPENLAMCLTEEHLFLGQTADQLRDTIRRGRGAESLTGHDDYTFLLRRFQPGGPLRVFLNVPRLIARSMADGDPKMAKAFGLDGFGSLVGYSGFGKPGAYESKSELLLRLRGARTGFPELLSMDNVEIAPGRSVPQEASIYFNLHIQPSRMFDGIVRITRQIDPEMADEMTAGMGPVDTPDGPLNVRKDILDNLRGPLQFMMLTGRPYAPETMRMLASCGHRDHGAMSRLLEMMRTSLPVPLTDRDFEGQTLYEAPIGGMAVCAASDTVLIGSTAAVEARLRGSAGSPLEAGAAWRKAAGHVPEKAWLVIFVDARQMFEAGLALAARRDQVMAMAMTNPAAAAVLGMAESMTLAPQDDKIEQARPLGKYQAASLLTISTDADGLLLTQVQLHPEAN